MLEGSAPGSLLILPSEGHAVEVLTGPDLDTFLREDQHAQSRASWTTVDQPEEHD